MERPPIVAAMVGDRWVGKSALYVTYTSGKFPEDHVSAEEVEDCEVIGFNVGERRAFLDLFEVSGDLYDYKDIRYFNYRRSHIILLCFSVIRPTSLANVLERWAPEVKKYCHKGALVLLVGTQVDLREDKQVLDKMAARDEVPVTYEQGQKIARKIKAMKYLECSAKSGQGVDNVFGEVLRFAKLLQRGSAKDLCTVS